MRVRCCRMGKNRLLPTVSCPKIYCLEVWSEGVTECNNRQDSVEGMIRLMFDLLMMRDPPCFLRSKVGVYIVIDMQVDRLGVVV